MIDALHWLHRSAPALWADPERLSVLGESAGGNLAAVAAPHLSSTCLDCSRPLALCSAKEAGRLEGWMDTHVAV